MESTTGQTLSPEAAVFVPRQGSVSVSGPFPLQQIPTYMTNCYPFVQDSDRARAGWNRGPRPRRHPGPKQARNIPGFSGNRFPGPHSFGPPVHTFPAGQVENPWTSPVLPIPPLINNLFPSSESSITTGNDGGLKEGQGHNLPKYPNSSRRQWSRTGSRNDSESSQDNQKYSHTGLCDTQTDIVHDSWHGNKGQKVGKGRGRKKEWQKERQNVNQTHVHGNNNHKKVSEQDVSPCVPFAGGHTIIVKESSVQTDFPDSYADLSLMSHPSSFYLPYLGDSIRKSRSHSNSDLDSDSGYNSPLHKRNGRLNSPYVSVGTLSMTHVVNVAQTPDSVQCDSYSQLKDSNSNNANVNSDYYVSSGMPSQQSESPQKFSYAFIAKKKPVPQTSISEPVNVSKPDSAQDKHKNPTVEKEKSSRKNRRSKSNKENMENKPASKHQPISGPSDQSQADDKKENMEDEEGEGKKKRKRKRKRKKKRKDGDESDGGAMKDSTPQKEVELHFEDEEEFPDLMASTASGSNKTGGASIPLLSYSAMLKSSSLQKVPSPDVSETVVSPQEEIKEVTEEGELEMVSKAKSSKRRRRRQEMLQKAADEELAEISLEQQMLRELNLKPKQKGFGKEAQTPGILKVNQQPQASGKKSKQAVSLDLSAMIDALEKKKTDVPKKSTDQKVGKKRITSKTEEKQPGLGHNLLDSSAPTKRGKERENPKPKKPSSLKKVILKEREEKKKLKLLDDSESHNSGSLGLGIVCGNESDLSQDGMSIKSMNEYSCVGTPASNDLSPISQTSPISMSPLSPGVSPQSSEVNSPIAGIIGKEVRMKIHSRRFREYCNQVLNKDIDNCCTELLKDLVRFQDRMYHKDPTKAKSKRRIVLGLREVTKHLKLRKIKCVIISPNLEKIQSKGGLDDALNNILNLCNEQNTPFVFALGRRALGRACAKLVPVSVVGIFNYEGSNENFTRLMELSEQARQSYKEMVSVIEKEIRDYPTLGAAAAVPHIYAHMGHSRTPSGASVLSFTSSILSEPISENYPHSEPETDSKGYEIVKEDSSIDNLNKVAHLKMRGVGTQELKSKMIYPSVNVDIDDGNEADTEEYEQRRRNGQGRLPSTEDYSRDEDSEGSSEEGSDTVKALPHIDSIHSSMQELNTEILSQNSGRTYECDAISTHSSRTLGDGSSTILADAGERSRHDTPKSAGSPSSTLQRGKVIDAERIQNWVHQTQSRLENLQQSQEDSGDSSDTGSDSDTNDNVEDIDTNSEHIKPHSDGQSQSNTSQDEQSNKGVGSHHSVKHKESDLDSTARGAQLDNTSSAYSTNTSTSRQESVQNHLPSIEEGSELTESEVSLEHKTTSVDVEEVEIAINT